jgi:hypothetical protein
MEEPSSTQSRTERDDPKRDLPKTASEEPMRNHDLKDNDAPKCMLSNTDIADPKRAKPITAIAEPIL